MKILWLVNIVLSSVCAELKITPDFGGGWLTGQLSALQQSNIQIVVCSPSTQINSRQTLYVGEVKHIVFPKQPETYSTVFPEILAQEKPDLVHIYGTEQAHAWYMAQFVPADKLLVSIQGLVSVYAQHYYAEVPLQYQKTNLLKRITHKIYCSGSLPLLKKEFELNGDNEIELLRRVRYVIGRTEWDRACTERINPHIEYRHCNEILRPGFYTAAPWSLSSCERYSIFVSQAYYPIKGLHMLLQALPDVIKKFPKTHLYVGGARYLSLKNRFLDKGVNYFFDYQCYIKKLISRLRLADYITFTGPLDEHAMIDRFSKSHVFVSASSIENSPNSVGEAMLLGVPVVSSNVGGVSDLLQDKSEGFLYPFDEPYMLSHYINRIFSDDHLAIQLSQKAKSHALKTHDRIENTKNLVDIYTQIIKKSLKATAYENRAHRP